MKNPVLFPADMSIDKLRSYQIELNEKIDNKLNLIINFGAETSELTSSCEVTALRELQELTRSIDQYLAKSHRI